MTEDTSAPAGPSEETALPWLSLTEGGGAHGEAGYTQPALPWEIKLSHHENI